jgi:hypothetical protein
MLLCALMNVWAAVGPCAAPDQPLIEKHSWSIVQFQENGFLLDVSADSKYVAAGGKGDARVFAIADGKEVVRIALPDDNTVVYGVFAADGKHLITMTKADGKFRYWNLATGKEAKAVEIARVKDTEWVMGFSPGGALLALKLETGVVLVDSTTGKVALELEGAGPGGNGFFRQMGGAFSADGKRFAAHAGKGRLAVWDIATGKQLALGSERHSPSGDFVFVRFSPCGRFLATGAGGPINAPIRVWDAATCELLAEPLKIEAYTTALAWTPDGNAVVTLDYAGVYATDVGTGKRLHKFNPAGGGLWGQPMFHTVDGKHVVFHSELTRTDPAGKRVTSWGMYMTPLPSAKKFPAKAELTAAELDALWPDLATGGAFRRAQVLPVLTAHASVAVPYLVKQAPVATAAEVKYLRELIEELTSDNAEKAKTARTRLAIRAHRYEALFRDAAPAAAPAARTVLDALLETAKKEPIPADLRSDLQAVDLLARLNTPDAVKHLKALAAGAPESRITADAKAALAKLKP